jgi:hypothetical protein
MGDVYIGHLRALISGRTSFSMHYDRYEAVPMVEPPPENFTEGADESTSAVIAAGMRDPIGPL